MLKKILINNAIALLSYVVVSILLLGLYMVITRPIAVVDSADAIAALLYIVLLCVAILSNILCGFLLKPVGKLSILSAASVAIALTILLILSMQWGEAGFAYYFLNPVAMFIMLFMEFEMIYSFEPFVIFLTVLAFLSPVFPSLLFYLGLVLKKRIVRRKAPVGDGLPDVPGP
jgi:hypothetical protein